jgi:transcriptional regulator with XRE-family HTH domain
MDSGNSGSGRIVARPGAALRALRKQNGWTLAEVSRRTGLRISALSKIELDRVALTYDKLSMLSEGLGLDFAQLLRAPSQPLSSQPANYGRRCIVRAGEGKIIDTKNYGHLYLATDLLNKAFVPAIVEIRARSLQEFGDLVRHEGDEFTYVLEGTLIVHTDVYSPAVLSAGDGIYFDSRIAHAYLNGGDGPCRALAICSRPDPSSDTGEHGTNPSALEKTPNSESELKSRIAPTGKKPRGSRHKRPV